jgi:hypothetical protein
MIDENGHQETFALLKPAANHCFRESWLSDVSVRCLEDRFEKARTVVSHCAAVYCFL